MLRSSEGRAQLAIITLWLAVAAAVADAYAHASRLRLVQDGVDARIEGVPLQIPSDQIDSADGWVTITLIASSLTLVVAAIGWLLWQHCAARMLEHRAVGWRGDPGRGVAVWLIPVVNLVAPLLVVAELVRAAGSRMHVALVAWWLCWVGSAVLAGVGTRTPEVLADQRLIDGLAVAGDVLTVAAAIIAIGIVRRVTPAAVAGETQAASA